MHTPLALPDGRFGKYWPQPPNTGSREGPFGAKQVNHNICGCSRRRVVRNNGAPFRLRLEREQECRNAYRQRQLEQWRYGRQPGAGDRCRASLHHIGGDSESRAARRPAAQDPRLHPDHVGDIFGILGFDCDRSKNPSGQLRQLSPAWLIWRFAARHNSLGVGQR